MLNGSKLQTIHSKLQEKESYKRIQLSKNNRHNDV